MKTPRSSTSNSKVPLVRMIFGIAVVMGFLFLIPRLIVFPQLCYQGIGCATLYRAPGAPFHRHFSFKKNKICGDLTNMTFLPQFCEPREDFWQTDDWGYRNEVPNDHPDILLFGDSFAFGAGMAQKFDPANQISESLHKSVYNGAGKIELNYLRWQLDHLKIKPKTVLYFHLERHRIGANEIKEWDKPLAGGISGEAQTFWDTFSRYDPFKIVAGRMEKRWLIPRVFPNRFVTLAPQYELENGRTFLFLPSSVNLYGNPRKGDLKTETESFLRLKEVLAERKVGLVVVLIPEKFNVYAGLLKTPPKPLEGSASYLDNLDVELKKRGVVSVDMLPVFKLRAAEALKKNGYIYFPDDSHWNPIGVKIMADEIKKNLIYF
jgi:hypothetical protein